MNSKAKLGYLAIALLLGAVVFGQSPLYSEEQKGSEVEVGIPSPPGVPALPSVELKVSAVQEAETPEDHRAIASFYQEESARLQGVAAQHAKLAEWWTNLPAGQWPSASHRYNMAEHCRRFADLLEEAAKEAQSLEKVHLTIAQSLIEGGA